MFIFFIVLALVVGLAVSATIHALVTDGHRQVPTDPSRLP